MGNISPAVPAQDDPRETAVKAQLKQILVAWIERVRGTTPLTRVQRKQAHEQLREHPQCALLMSALNDGDLDSTIDRHLPPDQRDAALIEWTTRRLPSISLGLGIPRRICE